MKLILMELVYGIKAGEFSDWASAYALRDEMQMRALANGMDLTIRRFAVRHAEGASAA
jgi:hypothetical protein